MRKYTKEIERHNTGLVIASVIRSDTGISHGLEFFHGFIFESEEHKLKRANKWADNLIKLLEKYEN